MSRADETDATTLESRLEELERRHRRLRLSLPFVALVALLVGARAAPEAPDDEPEILRIRGLVLEDAEGRPRMVLGAPISEVPERRYSRMPVMENPRVEEGRMVWDRAESAEATEIFGMLILDEEGYERIVLGDPLPNPAVGGRIYQRKKGRHWGMTINDVDGTERSGYGVWENGQVSLGLDWKGSEAVVFFAIPDGTAGLHVASRDGTARSTLTADTDERHSSLELRGDQASIELRRPDGQVVARLPK